MSDRDRNEAKEVVAQLSFGKKVAYYAGYYKIHALVVLALLIGIGLFIRSQVNYQERIMYFGVLDANEINEEFLTEQMLEYLEAGNKETIQIFTGLSTEADYSTDGGYNMMSIYMASDQLDIIFSDADGVEYLAKSGVIYYPEQWLTEDLLGIWSNRFYECMSLEENSSIDEPVYEKRATAVDISGTKLMENLGLEKECHYMVACFGSSRGEAVEKFCHYIYENE